MEDHELDLGQREADIALRMRAPVQADMIQRKLFTVHYHFCASKDYLEKNGTPKTLEDLANHTVIAYGETAAPEIRNVNSLLDILNKAKINLRGHLIQINNITGILRATEGGMGVAAIADYAAPNTSNLVRILPDIPTPTFDVHLAYTEALRNSKRVAAFRDFLVRAAKDWRY
jgi:DNA-binding transcriptional LysR family regulator